MHHFKKCSAEHKLIRTDFRTKYVLHCPECFYYEIFDKECSHEFIPILFTISNGNTVVRLYCTKCHFLEPNSRPKSDYNVSQLPVKDLAEYRVFSDRIYSEEMAEVKNFTDELSRYSYGEMVMDYQTYLSSDYWKDKRTSVLTRDNYTCQICGKPAEIVHHFSYVHIGNEFMFELVSLCRECHKIYHPDKKLTL